MADRLEKLSSTILLLGRFLKSGGVFCVAKKVKFTHTFRQKRFLNCDGGKMFG